MSKACEIFDKAFSPGRDPRSDEYRHGVREALQYKLGEINEACGRKKYVMGTAQADAFWAGWDEGWRRAMEYLAAEGTDRTRPNTELDRNPRRQPCL